MNRRELLKSSFLTCGAAAATNALRCWFPPAALADNTTPTVPIVETSFGKVRGAFQNGVHSFKGIHYGASTEGPARFQPPSPPKSWTGVRDALELGPMAPQDREMPFVLKLQELYGDLLGPEQMSEDCLVLNIWTPNLRGTDKHPVMLWLHGGACSFGSSGLPMYDGTNLAAKHDAVIVSLNHRLNIFGFLYLSRIGGEKYADSGNVGMLDIVLALRWVRDNIAQFGGDPANVTIFGESGGGWKVTTLMAMPAAKGLFQKAIVESGSPLRVGSPEDGDASARKFLAQLNVTPDHLDDLQKIPAAQLISALHSLGLWPGPVVDGHSLPRHPFDPDAPPLTADVPMLVGTTGDEATVFLGLFDPSLFSLSESDMRTKLKANLPKAHLDDAKLDPLIALYRKSRPNATPSDIFFAIATDRGMRMDAIIQAERKVAQHGAAVYMYIFEWQWPVMGGKFKAAHGIELPFVFDNLDKTTGWIGTGTGLQPLADKVSGAWVAFARNGNPNHDGLPHWSGYDTSTRATMIFNNECKAVNDPRKDERVAIANLAPST